MEKLVKTTVRLPEALWRAVKVRALDERADFQDIVARALEAYVKTALKRREGGR